MVTFSWLNKGRCYWGRRQRSALLSISFFDCRFGYIANGTYLDTTRSLESVGLLAFSLFLLLLLDLHQLRYIVSDKDVLCDFSSVRRSLKPFLAKVFIYCDPIC